jgi:NAD(P)-dependent dehydrogenase (short-subunit alcohol dehydrogenase family)
MQELAGKTAFVTGGASGIGLALGRAFAEAGMQVMLADIETEALAAAASELMSGRAGREAALVAAEGRVSFDTQQRALAMTHRLAVSRRLVRIAFLAEKPA